LQNLSVQKGSERITVIVDADQAGTWNFDALSNTYFIYVGTGFNELQLDYVSGSPNFNINNITYDQTITVEDLALNFDLAATDGDGDTTLLDDELTITMLDPDAVVSASVDGTDADSGVVLVGNGEMDTLIGGAGDDILIGENDDDLLIGGLGDDLMSGGAGSDIFRWQAGENGTDTITDFVAGFNSGGDQLDLSELLVGESGEAGDLGNLLSYIDISTAGFDTVLKVSSTAVADPAAAAEQTIVLQNVDLYASYGVGNEADLMLSMLGDGTLKVDTA
jgi:Ca2+-binding RTX toxin-like protein